MRKLNLFVIIAAIALFFGCSKSNENSNSTVWTYNGSTYTGLNTGYDTLVGMGLLGGTDANGNFINILFNSHPTTNGIFNLTNDKLGLGYSSSNCSVSVGNNSSAYGYTSTGKPGETISLMIVDGKMHVSLNNITITNGSDTTTVSGAVIQK